MTQLEGVDPQKIDVVYNGYDWSALTPDPARVEMWRQRIPGRPLIVAAGRLDPIKDLPTLLAAVALVAERHPTVTLAIAGSGPAAVEADLRSHARRLGIAEQVELLGYVDPLHELVAAADVFAQASLDEACSQTISEALGLGVPVAVTTAGGTAELVEDVQGPIAAQRPDLLARRLCELLDDPAAARTTAAAAAPGARERFATSLQLERYRQIYDAVAARGARP
jgi:glycosyltransferase involved in cell wall biosynthesis